jgi:hypothetical protein
MSAYAPPKYSFTLPFSVEADISNLNFPLWMVALAYFISFIRTLKSRRSLLPSGENLTRWSLVRPSVLRGEGGTGWWSILSCTSTRTPPR